TGHPKESGCQPALESVATSVGHAVHELCSFRAARQSAWRPLDRVGVTGAASRRREKRMQVGSVFAIGHLVDPPLSISLIVPRNPKTNRHGIKITRAGQGNA